MFTKIAIPFVLTALLFTGSAAAQLCPSPVTLRASSCPAGASGCSTKGSALTWTDLDANFLALVGICQAPGIWTTIDAPAGSDLSPAGAQALRFAAAAPLTITGNSGTQTLTFAAATATTTAAGVCELATPGETTAGLCLQASDPRLADSRPPSGPAGGDLAGSYPNPTVTHAASADAATTAGGLAGTASAGAIYAGPVTGSPAAPSFRSLVDADVPNSITVDHAGSADTATNLSGTWSSGQVYASPTSGTGGAGFRALVDGDIPNTITVDFAAAAGSASTATTATTATTAGNASTVTGGAISASDLTLKQGTSPLPTVEGRLEWDTDDDRLVIGTGSATALVYPGPHGGVGSCSVGQAVTSVNSEAAPTCGPVGATAHSALTGLSADDHPQYVLGAGRTGGQTIYGGTGASENLVLASTSNVTKGRICLGAAPAGGVPCLQATNNSGTGSVYFYDGSSGNGAILVATRIQGTTNRFFLADANQELRLSSGGKNGFASATNAVDNGLDTYLDRQSAGVMGLHDALRWTPRSTPPATCSSTTEGTVYYDAEDHNFCRCKGSPAAWASDGAGACS